MRKIFAFFFASLDGYHEAPGRDISWHQADDEFSDFDLAQLDEADTYLFGRVTYQGMAEFWPTQDGLEADPKVAERLNTRAKVVVSRTLHDAEWANTTIIGADVDAELRKLKEQPGKDIEVIGSAILTSYLLQAGLVDELRILVNPLLLGSGSPAFPITAPVSLELLRSRQFGNGNMLLVYRPETATPA
jgi:dihydrofolate reductase